MVNKAKVYIPDVHHKAYFEAINLIDEFNYQAEVINSKKQKYFKEINYNPESFQFAKSRSYNTHPEFDLMNIENVINQDEEYEVINFAIENYKYKKVVNENQFTQSLFHAVHVSQHCQIIPSSFQSLSTCIREVIKGWTNGDSLKDNLICDTFNVMTYENIAYNYRDLSLDAKKLIDKEMRMISISIYHPFSRQSDAVNFTVMIPKKCMAIIEKELWLQIPDLVSAGDEVKQIQQAKFPIKLIDTFEFDIPCKKETPIVRFVSNYNFHPLWTYPVESMLIASKKKMLYSIYLSCEHRRALKKAIEMGVIKFHPLLENFVMPVKRIKRAPFTDRQSIKLKELKKFEKDNFLTKKTDMEIVNSYKMAPYSLDPKNHMNGQSYRNESTESKRLYGGVKCKLFDDYLISCLTLEEIKQLDLKHQRKHDEKIKDLEHLSESTSSTTTPGKHENSSSEFRFNQLEKDILTNNKTTPLYIEGDCAEFPERLADVDDILLFMKKSTRSNKNSYKLNPTSSTFTPNNVPRNMSGALIVNNSGDDATLKQKTSKKVTKPKKAKKKIQPPEITQIEEITTINPLDLQRSPFLSQITQTGGFDNESFSNFDIDSDYKSWKLNPNFIEYDLSNTSLSTKGEIEFELDMDEFINDIANSNKSVQGSDNGSYKQNDQHCFNDVYN
ncbi:uncharacterized protein HGUI_01744 [Hanseniaspora guilliermondii]|uniref:Uncharacterized protein n=1 Tax=Hanseniaspora guilliermondii TaxID=56406 RepID=A0A1L0AZJ5_9ASCO|nr:uncharacterized protein HGUI_01744 [Hanseniaspora guilliermondii]